MKKIRLLWIVMLSLSTIPSMAQSEEEAKMAAQQFLQAKKGGVLSELSTVKVLDGASTAAKVKSTNLSQAREGGNVYAFNADNGGFAVVCTGNGNTIVAGYSDKGKVEVDKMPDAMKSWLASYASAMNTTPTSGNKEKSSSYEGSSVNPVEPLIKTQWGQGEPFNGKCPSNGKKTTVAGCVPVAVAQVLNYYRSNHKGTGQLYYANAEAEMEYDIDYANVQYDWDNMLNTYEQGKYSQTQADAVAKLMVECGVASKAQYGYNETTANDPFVALSKYYGFNCTYLEREYYVAGSGLAGVSDKIYYQPTAKWMKTIQDELTAGRPIIYSANDYNGHGGYTYNPIKSHCFIIDGIDADNYVHCNWGWSGLDDGYYDIAMLRPPHTQFIYHDTGFNCNHKMIVGIEPSFADYEEKTFMSMQPFDEYYFLYSNSYEDTEMRFAVVLANEDGTIAKFLGSYKATIDAWPYVKRWKIYNSRNIDTSGLEDGVYQIRLANRNSYAIYELCPFPDALIPTVTIKNNGTDITYQGIGDDGIVDDLTIENITPVSEIYAGSTFYLSVKGCGFKQSANINFRNVETDAIYGNYNEGTSKIDFNPVYDNHTSTEVFKFAPKNQKNGFTMPAGRYKIELPEDETDVKLNGEYYIDVAERPTYPIMDGSDWCDVIYDRSGPTSKDDEEYQHKDELGYAFIGKDGRFRIEKIKPQYTYANKVEEPVTVNIYMVNIDTGEEIPIAVDKEWIPGKYINIKYYCPSPFEGNFRFRSVYETNGVKRGGLVQYKNDDEYLYYIILHNAKMKDYASRLVSANVDNKNDQHLLHVMIKNEPTAGVVNEQVKAIIYDKANEEISIETQNIAFVAAGEQYEVNFTTPLKENTEYDAWIMTGSFTANYTLDENDNVARVHINKDASTSIAQTSLPTNVFNNGEQVKVYDLSGVLVKTLTVSEHLWTDMEQQLPLGVYIIKSANRTIKFRK